MNHLKRELLQGPAMRSGDVQSLTKLADKMYRCEISFKGWNKMWMLENEEIMHNLFERLPHEVKVRFVKLNNQARSGSFSDLRTLLENFVSEAESEYGALLYGKTSRPESGTKQAYRGRAEQIKNRRVCLAQCSSTEQTDRPMMEHARKPLSSSFAKEIIKSGTVINL